MPTPRAALGLLVALAGPARALQVVESQLLNMQRRELGPFVQLIEFSLGNQTMTGIFDTGSSDLIAPQAGSNICRKQLQQCNGKTRTGFVAGSFDVNSTNAEATAGQSGTVFPFVNGAAFQGKFVNTTVDINPNPAPGAAATAPGSGSNGNNGGNGGNGSIDGNGGSGNGNNGGSGGNGNNGGNGGKSIINNVVVGVFDDGQLPSGTPLFPIFGVGPIQGEAVVESQSGPTYDNLPQTMKNNGLIKSSSFGVYTNDFRGGNGSVVFGGVDRAKFDGELVQVKIMEDPNGALSTFVIPLSSVTVNGGGGRSSSILGRSNRGLGGGGNLVPPGSGSRNWGGGGGRGGNNGAGNGGRGGNGGNNGGGARIPAQFDTGNPGMVLPPPIIQGLAKDLRTSVAPDGSLGPIDCNQANSQNVLQFGFDNDRAIINVPLDSIVIPQQFAEQGQQGCQLPIGPGEDLSSLGAPFLQSAYVVFDMESASLHMAQAKPNVTQSRIEEFPPRQGP